MPNAINDIYIEKQHSIIIKTTLSSIADTILLIAPPILLVVGSVCNCLTIIVFSRPSLKKTTTAFLLIILAISDTLSLYKATFTVWLRVLFSKLQIPVFVEAQSDIGCKIGGHLGYTALTFSVWVLVTITLERLIAVAIPHRTKSICTKTNLRKLLIILFTLISVSYIPSTIYTTNKIWFRFGSDRSDVDIFAGCVQLNDLHGVIDVLVRVIIPFIAMLFMNITIIIFLYRSRRLRHHNSAQESKKQKKHKVYLTVILLTTSFTHLILTIPALFWQFYDYFYSYIENGFIWFAITMCLVYIDLSINFILYCISAQQVRVELRNMLRCKGSNNAYSSSVKMQALSTNE